MSNAKDEQHTSRRMGKCEMDIPAAFCLVIFGASGDLTRRKILPSVYRLFQNLLLPTNFAIIGAARTAFEQDAFRQEMCKAVKAIVGDEFNRSTWDDFAEHLYYHQIDYASPTSCKTLANSMAPIETQHKTAGNRIFYLAIPPSIYGLAATGLGEAGLGKPNKDAYTHIVIEKPFGRDTVSATELNESLRKYFREQQIYRMDHYLAKETVQNLLMFRFANSIFEPLWNQKYIDHVEITVAETLGIEHRAGYYEEAGVIRDMFQNHIFQLLALTAMEPPSRISADLVRDEKVKVFSAVRPFDMDNLDDTVAIGQYDKGQRNGEQLQAYTSEDDVKDDSTTPTYAAMKVYVDNWRWNGVPFYLRSGKRLSKRKAEITIHFRQAPHLMFTGDDGGAPEPNLLALRLQPQEGIKLRFQTKQPGTRLCLDPVLMDFEYPDVFALEAYERVLLDCMVGDQMLFVREDGVSATWNILTPLIQKIEDDAAGGGIEKYTANSDGPACADRLIQKDGRQWRPI